MNFLKPYFEKYRISFCVAVLFVMGETLCDLMLPTIMSQMIDIGVLGQQLDYIIAKGEFMLLITALGFVAASVRNILSSQVSQKFGTELRFDLYKKIQSLSLEGVDQFDRATLVIRLTNDVTQIQNLVNGLMRIFIKAPLLCVGSLIMATRLNAELASVLAVVVPIVGLVIFVNMKMSYPLFMKVQQALDQINSVMREYLSGIRVVKAFNRFAYEVEKFSKASVKLQKRSVTAMRLMSVFGPSVMLIVNFGIVGILWFGGLQVQRGDMQPGQIIAFVNYMTQMLFSLMIISMVFTMFVRARASAQRIGEVFCHDNSMTWEKDVVEDRTLQGRVDFEGVYFSYEGSLDQAVIKNINFTCLPGETIGIIGSTGSGKSSLVNLIPRFYDVVAGRIKVNGVDVRRIDPRIIRQKIAVVPQKTVLFSGSVGDNIRWGKEEASREEVEKAAKIAEIHDFITGLPEGYDTIVGQGGVNFSGGQKQRLAIARALVGLPTILILDDAMSAIDVATEANIKQSLTQYTQMLTCFIIAQRITAVMDADQILVLDQGEIVGNGKHEELMISCTVYQEIVMSQQGREL